MQKVVLIAGAILGLLGVVFGAFGAHYFKIFLEHTNRIQTYETAVKYQFYHALALLLIGLFMFHVQSKWLIYSAVFMMIGVVIFSGSLYILCFSGYKFWGAITPIGGILLIGGWGSLIGAFLGMNNE